MPNFAKPAVESVAFAIISRIPIIGDAPILVNATYRAGKHALNARWKHAGAEILSGVAQAALDDLPIFVGRDLGQELARFVVGREYLGPSAVFGKLSEPLHDKRDRFVAKLFNKNSPHPA